MPRRFFLVTLLVLIALPLLVSPAVARARRCNLELEVHRQYAYGETVTLHVSGLTGVGGIDIFTPPSADRR